MSLHASAHSAPGSLRQDVVIAGRHRLVTDQPAHLGGTDTGPSPHELLPAALAACVLSTIRIYASTRGWDVGLLGADVVYDHRVVPRHFDVTLHLPTGLTARQTTRLLHVAQACPVRRTIEVGVSFHEHLPRGVAAA